MKKRIVLFVLAAILMFVAACDKSDDVVKPGDDQNTEDILNNTYPEAQAELTQVLDDLYRTAQEKDFVKVRAYHAYGPKFTEFKNGLTRADSETNARTEEEIFSALDDLTYDLRDLKIAVYGDVAITTFHGYFTASSGGQPIAFNLQSTLVFADISGSWKIIHEHFSPLLEAE